MARLTYLIFMIALGILATAGHLAAQELKVFEHIPGRDSSEHYRCRVKLSSEGDAAWRDAFVLQTTAKDAEGYYGVVRGWTASWIAFESDFDNDQVMVEISKLDGSPITEAMVRPKGDASPAFVVNGKVYVTFSEPANVNVDINGQMEKQYTGLGYKGPPVHTITLFANPVFPEPDRSNSMVKVLQPGEDINALARAEWDTLIFAPGVHDVGMPFTIHSDEVLYIPGDAVVHGTIHPKAEAWGDDASKNWSVYGSGTISGEEIARHKDEKDRRYKPFSHNAEGAHLEGFVVADPAFHTFNMGHSSGKGKPNIYKNLKILAWRVNSDGVNAFRNSEVSGCFFRVQDDAFYLGQENVNQHHNTVWTDANGAVLFLQNVTDGSTCTFSDVKVIYARAHWHWWSGGRIVSIRELKPGQRGIINNVHVKNILVEDPFPAFPPFYMRILEGNGDVELNNIVIENVRQEADGVSTALDAERGKPQNSLLGLDEDRQWRNIWFKNCYFNGRPITSLETGEFKAEHVDTTTITFHSTGVEYVAIENCPTATLQTEQVYQLKTSTLPADAGNPTVSWSSSSPLVATVSDQGMLTAVRPGQATLTASASGGTVTAECPISVEGTADNELLAIRGPGQVAAGSNATVEVQYNLEKSLDVVISFKLAEEPYSTHGYQRATLPAGKGTKRVTMAIDGATTQAEGKYRYYVMLAPPGGGYPDRLDEMMVDGVDVVAAVTDMTKAAASLGIYYNATDKSYFLQASEKMDYFMVRSSSGERMFADAPRATSYVLDMSYFPPGTYTISVFGATGKYINKLKVE